VRVIQLFLMHLLESFTSHSISTQGIVHWSYSP